MKTYTTHIYIETEARGPRIKEAEYSYALEAVACGSSHMARRLEGVGKATGNEYSLLLKALEESMSRIREQDHSDIIIHTDSGKFADDIRNLEKWARNDFRKSNRQLIRNADRWKKIRVRLIGHRYRINADLTNEFHGGAEPDPEASKSPPHVEAST